MELTKMISDDYAATVVALNQVSKHATCIERAISLYVAKPWLAPFAKLDMPTMLHLAKEYLVHCTMMNSVSTAKATGDWSEVTYEGYAWLVKTFDEYYRYSEDSTVYRNGELTEMGIRACRLAHPEYVELAKVKSLDEIITPNPVGDFWKALEVAMPTDIWSMLFDLPVHQVDAVLELRLTLDAFDASTKQLKTRAKVRFIHTKNTNNKTPVLALSAQQKRWVEIILSHLDVINTLPDRVTCQLKHIGLSTVDVPEGGSFIKKSALTWVRNYDTAWALIL
jgi:hypothetical protein